MPDSTPHSGRLRELLSTQPEGEGVVILSEDECLDALDDLSRLEEQHEALSDQLADALSAFEKQHARHMEDARFYDGKISEWQGKYNGLLEQYERVSAERDRYKRRLQRITDPDILRADGLLEQLDTAHHANELLESANQALKERNQFLSTEQIRADVLQEQYETCRAAIDVIDRRADDALVALYGIDYEDGSRVARAVEAVEAIRASFPANEPEEA